MFQLMWNSVNIFYVGEYFIYIMSGAYTMYNLVKIMR